MKLLILTDFKIDINLAAYSVPPVLPLYSFSLCFKNSINQVLFIIVFYGYLEYIFVSSF